MARQDLEFVAEMLAQAVEGSTKQSRLQKGMALRLEMHQALRDGQPFDHYRMKWVSDSIDKVIDFSRNICRDFDAVHPEDMASALDLLDILRGAANLIEQNLRQK
jgi:hypothetical protein